MHRRIGEALEPNTFPRRTIDRHLGICYLRRAGPANADVVSNSRFILYFGLILSLWRSLYFAFDTPVLEEDLEGFQWRYAAGCVHDLSEYCCRIIPLRGISVMYRRP